MEEIGWLVNGYCGKFFLESESDSYESLRFLHVGVYA